MLTHADYFMTALCVEREGRGEPREGQIAIASTVRNRTLMRHTTPYEEVIKPWAFTSITGKGDPNLTIFPPINDPLWINIQILSAGVLEGTIADPTEGATLYYNPLAIESKSVIHLSTGKVIAFPEKWNPDVVEFVIQIGAHYFFREVIAHELSA